MIIKIWTSLPNSLRYVLFARKEGHFDQLRTVLIFLEYLKLKVWEGKSSVKNMACMYTAYDTAVHWM